MKLTYWVATSTTGDTASLREKTKKACTTLRETAPEGVGAFNAPVKIDIEYADGFDLLCKCLNGTIDERPALSAPPPAESAAALGEA